MPVFLSDEWLGALDGSPIGTDPELSFVLDQVVTGAPDGDVRYRVAIGEGRIHVTRPDRTDPDATLTIDYRTAVDLASGRSTANDAFVAGTIRFAGDPRRLQELATALGPLGGALAAMRAATTYPDAR